jgi:hypothetical protein
VAIKQHITYHEDYSIKRYSESLDGVETVVKKYNKKGELTFLWYSTGEWHIWKYKNSGHLFYKANSNEEYMKRRFDKNNRLTYEETQDGVIYDYSRRPDGDVNISISNLEGVDKIEKKQYK